ncbi:hypothetical protein FRC01_001460 [Tulasnella sp. 417]|nr:hypothetical protein FRC01_001460 [Tulasnella sp. 417]
MFADINVAFVLRSGFSWHFDPSEHATVPNTVRFSETVANQPAIKATWDDVVYAKIGVGAIALYGPTNCILIFAMMEARSSSFSETTYWSLAVVPPE